MSEITIEDVFDHANSLGFWAHPITIYQNPEEWYIDEPSQRFGVKVAWFHAPTSKHSLHGGSGSSIVEAILDTFERIQRDIRLEELQQEAIAAGITDIDKQMAYIRERIAP